jgi:tRNA-binding protein
MSNQRDKRIEWNDFEKIEIRVGTILTAENFEEVRNPAYKMTIDFGEFGIRKTSAQITQLYKAEELVGKQIIAVMNFSSKQIANIMSECLVLGAVEEDKISLLGVDETAKNGLRIA